MQYPNLLAFNRHIQQVTVRGVVYNNSRMARTYTYNSKQQRRHQNNDKRQAVEVQHTTTYHVTLCVFIPTTAVLLCPQESKIGAKQCQNTDLEPPLLLL